MATNDLPWGDDNFVPVMGSKIYPLWHIWAKYQTWLGGNAEGRYIPKVGDYVEDTDFHITYLVLSLNEFYVPNLKRITPKVIADQDSEDLLIGQTSDSFVCYVDTTVTPHRLQVDGRCHVNALNAVSARIYRGNPINGKEEIISLVLDQSGLPIGTSIPLKLSVIPNGQNVAQYYIPTAYTNVDLVNGEFLYAVLFDDTGAVLSSKALRGVVTSFLSSPDQALKAVVALGLEGPLMSSSVPNQLEIPLNLIKSSINLTGVVSYNSGTAKRGYVDGQKFNLLGMEAFAPTQAGQTFPMHLRYLLSDDEVSFMNGSAISAERYVNTPINCITVDVENQLSVKLYPSPEWWNPQVGYRLRWYMLNLDRNVAYDVTNLVEVNLGSAAFDPFLTGARQHLSVAIDLSKVNGAWRAYRHVQTVDITLLRMGNVPGQRWRIAYDPNQDPEYGIGTELKTKFVNANITEVDLTGGHATIEDWMKAYYYNTKPLINPEMENKPVYPTHYILANSDKTKSIKINIEDYWKRRFTTTFAFTNNEVWYMHFVKQGAVGDLILSVAPVVNDSVVSW